MSGEELKIILKKSGYTLKSIADSIGESPQYLQSLLNANDIKSGALERIAKAVNKSVYFFYNENKESDLLVTNEIQAKYNLNGKPPPECQECLSLKNQIKIRDKLIDSLEKTIKMLERENSGLRIQAANTDNNMKKNVS